MPARAGDRVTMCDTPVPEPLPTTIQLFKKGERDDHWALDGGLSPSDHDWAEKEHMQAQFPGPRRGCEGGGIGCPRQDETQARLQPDVLVDVEPCASDVPSKGSRQGKVDMGVPT